MATPLPPAAIVHRCYSLLLTTDQRSVSGRRTQQERSARRFYFYKLPDAICQVSLEGEGETNGAPDDVVYGY